jgi:hypothetical protein
MLKHLPCLFGLLFFVDEALTCYRAYDFNPIPILEGTIDKCKQRANVDWECYNVWEKPTCHSCVLENIRVKCARMPNYIEYAEELDCRRLRECILNLDFTQCNGAKARG